MSEENAENAEKVVEAEVVENLTSDDKLWGMLSHILVFCGMVGVPFGNLLAPLIIMLTQKDKSQYVVDNAKESLNFQIAYTIYAIGLMITIIGFIVLIPLVIAWIVYPIIAGMKANDGIKYQYPYIFRLIK